MAAVASPLLSGVASSFRQERGQPSDRNASAASPAANMTSKPSSPAAPEDVPEDILEDSEFVEPVCGGCKKMIDEESAEQGVIQFAAQLWHVDCFRCAKCQNPVSTDRDDILLLSDGHPICGQCNYSCQICGLPIMEEAIMTGDESYHASCFTCRSCHTPIEELVFAKTSQGIYCMSCHNERVARSRRNAANKRSKAKQQQQQSSKASSSRDRQGSAPPTNDLRSPSAQGHASPSPSNLDGLSQGVKGSSQDDLRAHSNESTQDSETHRELQTGSPWQGSSQGKASAGPSKRPTAPPAAPTLRELRAAAAAGNMNGLQGSSSGVSPGASKVGQADGATWTKHNINGSGDGIISELAKAASSHTRTVSGSSSIRNETLLDVSPSNNDGSQTARLPSKNSSVGLGIQDRNAAPSSAPPSTNTYGAREAESANRTRTSTEQATSFAPRSRSGSKASQTLSPPTDSLTVAYGSPKGNSERLSKAFSFYDPDFVSLMDSFGKFGDADESTLEALRKSPASKKVLPLATRSPRQHSRDVPSTRSAEPAVSALRGVGEEGSSSTDSNADIDLEGSKDEEEEDASALQSPKGADNARAKVRESMREARDGRMDVDTAFVEAILNDLDDTKERMKTLQHRYDKMKRASQTAARGFSSARDEYEAEVQARFEAESEMLLLKKKLVEQSSKLAEISTEKKKAEHLQRRSHQVKSTLQGMERDIAKLSAERDLHVAEVAELVAMRSERQSSGGESLKVQETGSASDLQRNLSVRLEGVKEKYRKEIDELTFERDALMIEIEELKQSRDVFLEESQTLNHRNEELNGILTQLTRNVEAAQVRADQQAFQQQFRENLPPVPRDLRERAMSGAGGRSPGGKLGTGSPSVSSLNADTLTSASASASDTTIQTGTSLQRVMPISKIEAAPPKKFKWMKPKLQDAARVAVAAASMPLGQSPPVPPKSMNGSSGAGSEKYQGSASAVQNSLAHQQGRDNARNASNEIVVREHLFQPFSALRPLRCFACQKSMWGQSEVRCALCGQACHQRCLQSLPTSCNQPFTRGEDIHEPTGPSMFGRLLVDQAAAEGRDVPIVVEKCISAVEAMGMDYEGIYRKSGGTSQLRVITQLFERGQPFNLEDVDRFNDVSAVTSVLKNYFRELPEPLLTFDLHEDFIRAAELKGDPGAREAEIRDLVQQLPRQHFNTLRALIKHLHRVRLSSEENRMTARNLGVVFGPTLMRSGDPSKEFAHMGGKAMTIEYMIENPEIFNSLR
ncbi:RhoGAP-domain-containing protein [Ceraceosorus guamensis]|uniref:RhoGAP-domain-containing protein n=1 Tax=Ceraceosorus guamensis TaxID=1522189 RepID=A0A316W8Z3_9BASI|nr:RhoGAP-domain-containing protein [Ceraceosorus guamensis]PWN44503.1 RhoGAP-domain-containing protein [Ceraceosorus guamensis]